MSPEYLGGNMWKLFEDEFVSGACGKIEGPVIVRVHEFPELGKLSIQGAEVKVEVEGTDFASVVQEVE